jgi:hypothetical protein
MTTRREFVLVAVPAGAALVSAITSAHAQPARLPESDPQALGLGYREDAAKVDAKKFSSYAAGRVCAGCQFFQGKATDAWGPCTVFGGKLVSAKGWCSAWAKKA